VVASVGFGVDVAVDVIDVEADVVEVDLVVDIFELADDTSDVVVTDVGFDVKVALNKALLCDVTVDKFDPCVCALLFIVTLTDLFWLKIPDVDFISVKLFVTDAIVGGVWYFFVASFVKTGNGVGYVDGVSGRFGFLDVVLETFEVAKVFMAIAG
jgi:hypothetical protein